MAAIELFVDFETRSPLDLKEVGLHNYLTQAEVLMLSYAVNEQEPQIWLPHEGPMPEHLEMMVRRPEILKVAFNAAFEKSVFEKLLGIPTPLSAWDDPMIRARYASVAGGLDFVGKVLGLGEDKAKLAGGKKLIKLFCEKNKKGVFNDWNSHPDEFWDMIEYCKRDTSAEREIFHKLKAFALPPFEQRLYELDQEVCECGMPIDMDFVEKAYKIVNEEKAELLERFMQLTGLENPNSPKQLLGWLKEQAYPFNSLAARWVTKALGANDGVGFGAVAMSEAGREGLKLRQQIAKSSTAKLETLRGLVCADGRLRHSFVFMGAARTGRWSGRGFQTQNLPRSSVKDVPGATEAIKASDREAVRKFGHPLDVVSSCLRSAIRAPEGKKLVVCDLSSIETRVSAWVAGCTALMKVFEEGRDPYIEFATKMYHVPYDQVTKQQRQISKPAILGACYQLGGGKDSVDKNGDDIRTGLYGYSQNMGVEMDQDFSGECIRTYRQSYPEICDTWRSLESAAIEAVRTGERVTVNKVTFGAVKPNKLLYIILPSGRRLHYVRPCISTTEKWDGEFYSKLEYEGQVIGQHWGTIPTFGGKLLENIVQAISRDILAVGMCRAAEMGFRIVGTCHDEIMSEEGPGSSGTIGLKELRECMIAPMPWAPDLLLDAAGFEGSYYRKD